MSANVAEAINAVMGKVGYIQKKGTNQFHNYKYAAIGDVLAELQPAMHEAGLIIVQDEVHHELIAGGTIMTAKYAFQLLHKSGEAWPSVAHHTGMAAAKTSKGTPDDKALNKCHTAARKYFLMALFQIPTGEAVDPDADGDVPTKKAKPPQSSVEPVPDQELSAQPRMFRESGERLIPAEAKRRFDTKAMQQELWQCQDGAEVAMFVAKHQSAFDQWPLPWLEQFENVILAHEAELAKLATPRPPNGRHVPQSTLEAG